MFCSKCGNEIPDNSSFCHFCGNTVNNEVIIGGHSDESQNFQEFTEEQKSSTEVSEKIHIFALTGFIVSLSSLLISLWGITPIVGIVFSAIAFYQLKDKPKCSDKNFAIAGLAVGIAVLAFSIVVDIIACSAIIAIL